MILLLSFIIPIILAAIAGVMAFRDARIAPPHKRRVRMFEACVAWYFVVSYAAAWLVNIDLFTDTGFEYIVKSGLITRFGVVLLLIWLIADIYTSEHPCRKK